MKEYLEVLLGRYPMYDNQAVAEIYKNPSHLSNFTMDIRGLLTFKGNLYVMESLNHDLTVAKYGTLIHPDMVHLLAEKGEIPGKYKNFDYNKIRDLFSLMNDFILVTRHGKTNKFMMSESYIDELKEMNDKQEGVLKEYQAKMKKRGFELKLAAAW